MWQNIKQWWCRWRYEHRGLVQIYEVRSGMSEAHEVPGVLMCRVCREIVPVNYSMPYVVLPTVAPTISPQLRQKLFQLFHMEGVEAVRLPGVTSWER